MKKQKHDELRALARDVHRRLKQAIPAPRVELDHENAWQLLVATILSAQSTDKKINEVTPHLFARWPTAAALAGADPADVERVVKPTGFYRNKTKAIVGASRGVAERFGGEVPRSMGELLTLPGVARKTANVILSSAYGIGAGIVVDTHVTRVSRRLELALSDDPAKIEEELCDLFPNRSWAELGHRMVLHGRYVCTAKRPRCERCPLQEICASAEKAPEVRSWTKRAAWERTLVESKGATDVLPS
jgi:endonuclease-3